MKALDSFTVERLEELARAKMISGHDIADIRALARIALAAKKAEPVTWWSGPEPTLTGETESFHSHTGSHYLPLVVSLSAYNTRPQLNSPEIPEGWKLAPLNPTAEMMAAAMECDDVAYDLEDDTIFCVQFDNIYAAMLAAAPEKP